MPVFFNSEGMRAVRTGDFYYFPSLTISTISPLGIRCRNLLFTVRAGDISRHLILLVQRFPLLVNILRCYKKTPPLNEKSDLWGPAEFLKNTLIIKNSAGSLIGDFWEFIIKLRNYVSHLKL